MSVKATVIRQQKKIMKISELISLFISHYRHWRLFSCSCRRETPHWPAGNKTKGLKNTDYDVKLAFIGSIVPDEPAFHTPAFSRAGNMCQQNLLISLMHAGLHPSTILSFRPEQSFPGGRCLWIGKEQISLSEGMSIDSLPFINITPLKQIMIGLGTLWALLLWAWRMRHTPHRVVYTFNITVPSAVFTLLGAWITRSKAVAMIYDINVPGETVPSTCFYKLDYWLHKKLLPLFDGLVVITDSISNDFASKIPFIRVEGGIKNELVQRFTNVTRKTKNGNAKSPFILVVAGGLDEANGISVILEAFSLLEGDDYRLDIAGTGPLEDIVRQAANKDERINFQGFIPFDEVLKLYDSADVLVNMRLTKAINTRYFFPSKIMECLTSGVPVISTCPGHVTEEFSDFAFLLKDERPVDLANMIKYVASLAPDIRADKAAKAQEYMIRNKTWDVQGLRVVKFINSLFESDERKVD